MKLTRGVQNYLSQCPQDQHRAKGTPLHTKRKRQRRGKGREGGSKSNTTSPPHVIAANRGGAEYCFTWKMYIVQRTTAA